MAYADEPAFFCLMHVLAKVVDWEQLQTLIAPQSIPLQEQVKVLPDFFTAKDTRSFQGKFSASELVRAIRFSVAAEYEAVQLYDQIVEATDDPHVKAVIRDIISEERLHAGQFLELLYRLAPDEKAIYEEGFKENQNLK